LVAFHGDFRILPLVVPVGVVTLVNVYATYFFNDITDQSVDAVNDPKRAVLLQEIGRPVAYSVVGVLMALGLGLSYSLGPLPLAVCLLEDALGLAYSIPVISFKDRFVVKTLSIALGATLASIFGGVVGGQVSAVFLPAIGAFVYLFAVSPLSDLVDIKGDLGAHRRTIPIVVGAKRTILISILMAEIPVTVTIFFGSVPAAATLWGPRQREEGLQADVRASLLPSGKLRSRRDLAGAHYSAAELIAARSAPTTSASFAAMAFAVFGTLGAEPVPNVPV